jgi:microcompartment protein CcmK/EutM
MQLGRVAGTLVASRKEALMTGMKFLVVRQLDEANSETGS